MEFLDSLIAQRLRERLPRERIALLASEDVQQRQQMQTGLMVWCIGEQAQPRDDGEGIGATTQRITEQVAVVIRVQAAASGGGQLARMRGDVMRLLLGWQPPDDARGGARWSPVQFGGGEMQVPEEGRSVEYDTLWSASRIARGNG